ncbi:MAG TPA: hypothetical protein VFH73_07965 [Polyangia bacterium]|jgi:hypothetical protein|nr:hypothetical protein [Polyangia bacterium]
MSGLLASVLLAIEIHASGNCPGGADVEQRIGPLLGAETAARTSDVATIKENADGSLLVSLDDSDRRPIGERRFPRAGTCADQAERIAVTLAIWEAQIHPEIVLRLDRLSPEVAPARAPAPPAVTLRTDASSGAPRAPALLSLGAAVAGDWQSGAWVPAVRADLGLGRTDGRWRARLAGVAVGQHTLDVPPGQASWWRAILSVGADYDLARGRRWAVVLGGGAVAGLVSISGSGFALNRTSRSIDAGAELRVRAEWRPGRVRPWLGALATGWLRRQNLDLRGSATSSTLPRVEPMLALGADFVW